MSKTEEREFITKEKALKLIGKKDEVHVFLNPGPAMLVGADWSMKEINELLDKSETIEIGGEQCKQMKHPIVVFYKGKHHFIEAELK